MLNNSIKVSVIVPVYNAEKFIARCIHSLMKQTLTSVEFIIIDDGSIDNSFNIINQVIQHYPARIEQVSLISRENKGVAKTRDEGIKLSKGKYIIHLDSDDWANPDWLSKLYRKAEDEKADIVFCNYKILTSKGEVFPALHTKNNRKQYLESILNGDFHGFLWNKLILGSLIRDNELSIDDVGFLEDLIFITKAIVLCENISFVDKCLITYNKTNEKSITKSIDSSKIKDIQIADKIVEDCLVENYSNTFEVNINRMKLNHKFYFLVMTGSEDWSEAISTYPESKKSIKYSDFDFLKKVILRLSYIIDCIYIFKGLISFRVLLMRMKIWIFN